MHKPNGRGSKHKRRCDPVRLSLRCFRWTRRSLRLAGQPQGPFLRTPRFECFEETGLLVKPVRIIGVFGGPEFLIRYPNGDVTYYTTVAFEASIVGGSLKADGHEIARLSYFTQTECGALALTPT